MTDRSASEVVVSRDGRSGLGIIKFEGRDRTSFDPSADAFLFAVKLVPKAPESQLSVKLHRGYRNRLTQIPLGALANENEAFEQLGLYAIGHRLDTEGMFSSTPSGTRARGVHAGQAVRVLLEEQRPQASDEDVRAYAAAKIYWGWKFGLAQVRFSMADHLRLAVPLGEIARVALAEDDVYWKRIGQASPAFSPTAKLLQDLPAGRVPGLDRSPVFQVQEKLGAPRYAAPRQHFAKAMAFLTGQSQDFANSAKEATLAVESLALLVTGRNKGTLGNCIKELRRRGDLPAPLDRVFEALWGYASEEPGVRHGNPSPPFVAEREAALVVNLAASVIFFLLDLDRERPPMPHP